MENCYLTNLLGLVDKQLSAAITGQEENVIQPMPSGLHYQSGTASCDSGQNPDTLAHKIKKQKQTLVVEQPVDTNSISKEIQSWPRQMSTDKD